MKLNSNKPNSNSLVYLASLNKASLYRPLGRETEATRRCLIEWFYTARQVALRPFPTGENRPLNLVNHSFKFLFYAFTPKPQNNVALCFELARLFNKKPIQPLLYKGMVERTFSLKI